MRPRSIILPTVVAAVVAVVALILAGGSNSPVASNAPHNKAAGASSAVAPGKKLVITIQNFAFHPASVTVRAGTVVTVINRDQTPHSLTANDGAFDTGSIGSGQAGHLTLTRAGSFAYHCVFHAFMTGSIKVVS